MSLMPRRKSPLGALCYWLQLSRVDGEQAKGLGLDRRRGGDQAEAISLVEGAAHLVECAGREVAQQAVKAVDRAAIGGDFAGTLAQRGQRRLSRGDDRGALAGGGSGIVVIEQHRFEALTHVPFDMAGKHAQEDLGAHPRRQPMVDRAQVQIDGLQAAKGALDAGEVLVGADDTIGRQGIVLDAGADDVKTIEPGLGGDAGRIAGKAEAVFGDSDVEQLGELVAVFDAADGARNLVLPSGAGAASDLVGQLGQCRFGGLQQILALARPLLGQQRFLQTTSRSPGNSGAVISARSRSSNSESWKAPVSSRARICGALSAVIQSSPAGFSSSRMRALVIMPRSPTSTTRDRPKRSLSLSICVANVIGSAVLPSNTSTATGQPSAAHNRP